MRTVAPRLYPSLGLLLFACSEDVAPATLPAAAAVAERAVVAATPPAPPSIYDQAGRLKPSDQRVAGLNLPQGTEMLVSEGRLHLFQSGAPVDRLRDYFADRLDTGSIVEHGPTVIFERALPREARGAEVPLMLRLFPAGRERSRIEIREVPAAASTVQAVSPNEVQQRLQEAYKNLD